MSEYKVGFLVHSNANAFSTTAEVIDSKEWKDFWAKVRVGEIGGDE